MVDRPAETERHALGRFRQHIAVRAEALGLDLWLDFPVCGQDFLAPQAHSVFGGGRTGASRVAAAQLRFLQDNDFDVHCLIIGDAGWQHATWYAVADGAAVRLERAS